MKLHRCAQGRNPELPPLLAYIEQSRCADDWARTPRAAQQLARIYGLPPCRARAIAEANGLGGTHAR